eukprot:6348994-Pyramimonas_sp.AAC.1
MVHIGGGWVHPSHMLVYPGTHKVWICSICGFFGSEQLRSNLAEACSKPLNPVRRRYLANFEAGQ